MLVFIAFGNVSYGIKIEINKPDFTVNLKPIDKDISNIGLADPYVEITSPPDGTELPTNYIEVLGYAMDSDSMYFMEWTYQHGSYIYSKNNTFDPATYINFRIRVFDISPGTHIMTVTFYDIYNNTGSDSVTVYYGANNPPSNPSTPSGPDYGSINIDYSYSTQANDPNGDKVSYGWDWDGDNVVDEWTGFYPSGNTVSIIHKWNSGGTYYVKVKAMDTKGAYSSFSNQLAVHITSNTPPSQPDQPYGPAGGRVGTSYSYHSKTVDAEGHRVYYMFDWDDGTISEWNGPYQSGQRCTVSHIWQSTGTFNIKVKAIDDPDNDGDLSDGLESIWSVPSKISLTKSKLLVTQNLLHKYPLLRQILIFFNNF